MKMKSKILTLALAAVLIMSFVAVASAAEKKALVWERVKIVEVKATYIKAWKHMYNWDHTTRAYAPDGSPILISQLRVPCLAKVSYYKSDDRVKTLKEIRVIEFLRELPQ